MPGMLGSPLPATITHGMQDAQLRPKPSNTTRQNRPPEPNTSEINKPVLLVPPVLRILQADLTDATSLPATWVGVSACNMPDCQLAWLLLAAAAYPAG
jgi:hypothetical protein